MRHEMDRTQSKDHDIGTYRSNKNHLVTTIRNLSIYLSIYLSKSIYISLYI